MGYARKAALAAGVAVGAVMLAPTVLPFLGVGTAKDAAYFVYTMHGVDNGTGIAGAVNELLGEVPVFGETMVKGGMPAALLVASIGVGGWLLGKFVEKKEGGAHVKLGKIIRYAALATSALIALPATLTAIGIGLTYLAHTLVGTEFSSLVMNASMNTLGVTGEASASGIGLPGIAATLPHLFTCGASLVPLGLAVNDGLLDDEAPAAPPPPYTLRITPKQPLAAGEPVEAVLSIINNKTGKALTPEELAVVHTKKLHVFVVDDGLKDYHHLHPEPTSTPGEFAFSFTPKTGHDYQCFAELTTQTDGQAHRLHTELAAEKTRRVLPAITTNTDVNMDGLQFAWRAEQPLRQGEPCMVDVSIRDASGKTYDKLEPVMGAYAHLVGFSANGGGMVHCHPLGREPQSTAERGVGTLQFHVEPEVAGATQFFLQIQKNGQDVFVPFGQYVAPASKATDRLEYAQQKQHAGGHHAGLALG